MVRQPALWRSLATNHTGRASPLRGEAALARQTASAHQSAQLPTPASIVSSPLRD